MFVSELKDEGGIPHSLSACFDVHGGHILCVRAIPTTIFRHGCPLPTEWLVYTVDSRCLENLGDAVRCTERGLR